MSESVDIILKADDQATATIKSAADKIDANVKRIKDVGGKAKASTEFIGVIAQMSGNSQIAGLAGQFAGLTEKMGQFSEVSKAGGVGAAAFKLGLVGLVATISFGIGNALGNAIYQTNKWKEELDAATKSAQKLDAATLTLFDKRFRQEQRGIELIRNPEEQLAANKALLDKIQLQIDEKNKEIEAKKNRKETSQEEWHDTPAMKKQKRDTTTEEGQLDLLRKQAEAQRELTNETTLLQNARAKENAALDKSESYVESLKQEVQYLSATKEEQYALDAARNATPEMRDEAIQLLKERDAIKAKTEAEKELAAQQKKTIDDIVKLAEQANADREREQESIDNLIKSEQERIDLRKIELEQGKEAAKVQSLMNKGVDEERAKLLARQDEELAQRENALSNSNQPNPNQANPNQATTNTASESRLLSRGPQQDNGIKLLQSSEQILKELQQQRKENADAKRTEKKDKAIRMKVVS